MQPCQAQELKDRLIQLQERPYLCRAGVGQRRRTASLRISSLRASGDPSDRLLHSRLEQLLSVTLTEHRLAQQAQLLAESLKQQGLPGLLILGLIFGDHRLRLVGTQQSTLLLRPAPILYLKGGSGKGDLGRSVIA